MMRGTAVVASGLGGPAEVVLHGRTGLLVEPASAGSLAAALSNLLLDRDLCERLGAAGRALALEHYTEDRAVARFEKLYAELVSARSR
jgi:glycosyltransferase involved in cell wall biosynthesis